MKRRKFTSAFKVKLVLESLKEHKEKDKLLRTIGELKVENDFLKKSLR